MTKQRAVVGNDRVMLREVRPARDRQRSERKAAKPMQTPMNDLACKEHGQRFARAATSPNSPVTQAFRAAPAEANATVPPVAFQRHRLVL